LASQDPDVYSKLNDVIVEEIKLTLDQGGSVDLSDLCVHFDIFEDMDQPFLTGVAKIIDAIGFRTHLPFSGSESITIKYRTPGIGSKIVTADFDVLAMDGRTKKPDDRSEIYDLRLVSKAFLLNEIQRVEGAYQGKISDIVKQIIEEYLPDFTYTIEETRDEYKFVIPNMKPVDAIRWLANKAVSKQEPHDSNFVFYETVDSLIFASIGRMSQERSKKTYHSKLSSIDDGTNKTRRNFLKIQEFEVARDFDVQDDMKAAGISSRLVTHDLTTKTVTFRDFNYIKDFDGTNHLEANRKFAVKSKYFDISNGRTFFLPKQTQNYGELYDKNYNFEDYFLKSKSSRQMWNNNALLITAAGDSTLRLGMVVSVELPSNEPNRKNDPEWLDKYSSGKYVITALRHSILNAGGKEYTNMIELSRDSLPTAIPDNKTFLGSSKEDGRNETSVFA